MSRRLLNILYFPPPVHGAAMIGEYIKQSESINNAFFCRYINLGTSRSIDEIGQGGLIKWWRYSGVVANTLKNLITFRPHLVYITLNSSGVGFYKDALIAILAKAFRRNVVYHFHNKGVSTRQNKWFDNILYKLVFRNADVILLSEHLYPDIQKYVSKNRVHFCPNGTPEILQSSKLKNQSGASKTVEILFLSNLIESKGVFVLLGACEILMEKGINFHCTYVGGEGDISPEQLQQKIGNLGLCDNVHYAGRKYGSDKFEIFSNADIFVHPSSNDCFPLVLLEAMQFSLPVVSTYEGGIPGIVNDFQTGFLVPKNNATALAEKLEPLIKDPLLRKEMGKQGREKYKAKFTLEKFEKQFSITLSKIYTG